MRGVGLLLVVCPFGFGADHPDPTAELAARLKPFVACFSGQQTRYALRVQVDLHVSGRRHKAALALQRFDGQAFRLTLEYRNLSFDLRRTGDRTALLLPGHKTAIVGTGRVDGIDNLSPRGSTRRLVSSISRLPPYVGVLTGATADTVAVTLRALAKLRPHPDDRSTWTSELLKGVRIRFPENGCTLVVTVNGSVIKVTLAAPDDAETVERALPGDMKVIAADRAELERVFARGVRRAGEVLAPAAALTHPPRRARRVPNGELRWQDDQRLVLLWGTPHQIGRAHGRLLGTEVRRLMDSTLFLMGVVRTVQTGRWYLDDLRHAYRRLQPFIPADHQAELDALADAAGVRRDYARLANVFPELFHCSGFALFGRATRDHKLYHGRVLDYMTQIGLQDAAALFVVAAKGKHALASVGYAGFIGCVSGMNVQQISLGEMGGRGDGQWDGVPMATLMRRALEECATLDEVRRLWIESPRTCEYFYVFADGKIPDAVAVSATPERVEFLKPGQPHARLGEGLADVLLLSAGSRLSALRRRVRDGYGRFGTQEAIRLMDRPVAMRSNLHNVLFVPQDLLVYVAHADHSTIAARRPYVRYDLRRLFKAVPAAGRAETVGPARQ